MALKNSLILSLIYNCGLWKLPFGADLHAIINFAKMTQRFPLTAR